MTEEILEDMVDKFEYVVAYLQPYSVEEDQKAVDDQRLLNISKLMVKLWMQFKIQSLEWSRICHCGLDSSGIEKPNIFYR